MKIDIRIKLMDSISPEELFMRTVKPIALEMHSKKGAGHKYNVYQALSNGQKAAFMLWVLYSHGPNETQFYTWMLYMRQPKPDYWHELWIGMKHIGCTNILTFMKECDAFFSVLEEKKLGWTAFKRSDLKDPVLMLKAQNLYLEFRELVPKTIDFIGLYIKDHVKDFLN